MRGGSHKDVQKSYVKEAVKLQRLYSNQSPFGEKIS